MYCWTPKGIWYGKTLLQKTQTDIGFMHLHLEEAKYLLLGEVRDQGQDEGFGRGVEPHL